MNFWTIIGAGLAAVVALIAGAFLIFGPARIWSLFGPADLGSVIFEQLERRTTPNDALACPQGLCKAKSDVTSPLFKSSARDLRAAFEKVIASEVEIVQVDSNEEVLTDRYIQRSRLMQFPDTVVVRFLDQPAGQSTLAIYSRSQLGESDLGVNRQRIERWLEKLTNAAGASK